MLKKTEVLGLGALMVDRLLEVSDEFVNSKVDGEKGGMVIIDKATMERYFSICGELPKMTIGGCEANTISVLSDFGHSCGFIGKIGDDSDGRSYEENFRNKGINPIFIRGEGGTGQMLGFITPDGERTMRTYLGASANLFAEDLKPEMFENVGIFHLVSYSYMNEGLVSAALKMAKDKGAKVSFGLGCFEIAKNFRTEILDILENYVDIVFGNQNEARALTGQDERTSCNILGELCETAVVHIGDRGCWVKRGGEAEHFPVTPVKPLDSTGAGDMFAAGFLHAYLNGDDNYLCAEYGMQLGAAIVQVFGTDFSPDHWKKLLSSFESRRKHL